MLAAQIQNLNPVGPIPPQPAPTPAGAATQVPPLQAGGQPIPGVDADKQREKDAFWIALDEAGAEHVMYTDELGQTHAVENGDFWVYSDENGEERVVTAEQAKTIARALHANTYIGSNVKAAVVYSVHARSVAIAAASKTRVQSVEAKTSVSAYRPRTAISVESDGGDGEDV